MSFTVGAKPAAGQPASRNLSLPIPQLHSSLRRRINLPVPVRRNSSSLYFCLGGVLGLAVVLLAGLSLRQSVGVRLADRTRLRVLGHARGSNPVLEYPAEYTRPPVAWIPLVLRERLHLHTWTRSAGIDPNPEAVFVWFVRYDSKVGGNPVTSVQPRRGGGLFGSSAGRSRSNSARFRSGERGHHLGAAFSNRWSRFHSAPFRRRTGGPDGGGSCAVSSNSALARSQAQDWVESFTTRNCPNLAAHFLTPTNSITTSMMKSSTTVTSRIIIQRLA